MSVSLATRRLGLRLEIDQGFQNVLEHPGISLVTGLIAGCEDDISDSLRKLDVADAFPLRVILSRGVFVDEVVVAVLSLAGRYFLLRGAVFCLHFLDRHFNE